MKYVALLRGINVGGHTIKMAELKTVFESMKFENVKTLLASGNVLFETPEANSLLTPQIEERLEKKYGYKIGVILRSSEQIQLLITKDPFKDITVTPETRLYVTFLSEKPTSTLKIPYETPDKNFKILSVTETEVCSVLTLTPDHKTVDLMSMIEKEYGKKVTTRNWNTVLKVYKALQ